MPIRPENRHRYPTNWPEIRAGILDRAAHRCECRGECGLHAGRRCTERDRTPATYARGRIVLTVAHLDHTPENCDPANLRAMCQRCHLRYDRTHHAASLSRRADAALGQRRLFEAPPCDGDGFAPAHDGANCECDECRTR